MKYLLCFALLISCQTTNILNNDGDLTKAEVCTEDCAYQLPLTEGFITYYASHPIDQPSGCIERAIIVVHGANRNGDDYFGYMMGAVAKAKQVSQTLVIAPSYKHEDDNPAEGELYWSNQGWRKGNIALNADTTSSYDFIDTLIDIVITNFPTTKEIILTGHSAGGQLTQRYAVLSKSTPNIPMRYIPANLSSYMYLDEYRPSTTGFRYPWKRNELGALVFNEGFDLNIEPCARDYNDYKYGFEQKNTMGLSNDSDFFRERYVNREVIYFLGDADTEVNEWVDTSCPAMLQGPNRYERGLTYQNYIQERYPEAQHKVVVVPNVAHSAKDMYQSEEGIELLFEDSLYSP